MAGFDGTDVCWIPDIPYGTDREWRLRVAQFGDGYAQRTLDGINALNIKWQLTWAAREKAVINAMVAYLEAQKANAFTFKDPATAVVYQNVWCDTWHVEWETRRRGSAPTLPLLWGTLTAEFVKANGITV
jgi:phage-related protein